MSVFQRSLFEQSTRVKIVLKDDHELVTLTGLINWTELANIAMTIRDSKKAVSGPQPRYRALLGAVALMATKKMTYREAEDLIAHYAPARYLCDLMDSDLHLDHVTIFDFTKMLGIGSVFNPIFKVRPTLQALRKYRSMCSTSLDFRSDCGLNSLWTSSTLHDARRFRFPESTGPAT